MSNGRSIPSPQQMYRCPTSEYHDIAWAIDTYDTAYCIDCRKTVTLVRRDTIVCSVKTLHSAGNSEGGQGDGA